MLIRKCRNVDAIQAEGVVQRIVVVTVFVEVVDIVDVGR